MNFPNKELVTHPTQLFIIGTGRCGTTTLAHMLSSLPGCRVRHEIEPPLIEQVSDYLKGKLGSHELLELLRQTRSAEAVGGRRLSGESNQRLSFILPVIANAFPAARYIWLMRDGRDVVASTYQRGWYSEEYDRLDPIRARWERYRITAVETGQMSRSDWNALPTFAKNCWYWAFVNKNIKLEAKRLNLNIIKLRLEEMQRRFPDLLSSLDLDAAELPEVAHTNANNISPLRWPQWSRTQRRWFQMLAGDVMDQHYIGWRDDWQRSLRGDITAACRRVGRLATTRPIVRALAPLVLSNVEHQKDG